MLSTGARAQWMHYPTPGIPRTRDGEPNLSAPAPKASNGKPDLSGLWQVEPTPGAEMTRLFGSDIYSLSVPGDDISTLSKYVFSVFADLKPEEAPIRPEAARIVERNLKTMGTGNPTTYCLPASVPFGGLLPFPNKFVQTSGLVVILEEADGNLRQIFTDGRKHTPDPQPTWMGYSVGRWEGDTLVVDTVGFNDKGWLDGSGHPRSESDEDYRNGTGGGISATWMSRPLWTILRCIPSLSPSNTQWTWFRIPTSGNTSALKTKKISPTSRNN